MGPESISNTPSPEDMAKMETRKALEQTKVSVRESIEPEEKEEIEARIASIVEFKKKLGKSDVAFEVEADFINDFSDFVTEKITTLCPESELENRLEEINKGFTEFEKRQSELEKQMSTE